MAPLIDPTKLDVRAGMTGDKRVQLLDRIVAIKNRNQENLKWHDGNESKFKNIASGGFAPCTLDIAQPRDSGISGRGSACAPSVPTPAGYAHSSGPGSAYLGIPDEELRARRKPRSWGRDAGEVPDRNDDPQLAAPPVVVPPRDTRPTPSAGPTGSVTASSE